MKMTKTRKNLQDKLRKRFGWKMFYFYHSGITTLCKERIAAYKTKNSDSIKTIDMNISLLPDGLWNELTGKGYSNGIRISFDVTDGSGRKSLQTAKLTFEELETIYKIAKEKRYEIISGKTGSGNVMEDENAED